MTLNGAIMQLVQMRESECMPTMFKPLFDKVIETVSECEEPGTPSAQPDTGLYTDGFADGYEQAIKDAAQFQRLTVDGVTLYRCDPAKNIACRQSCCFADGGPCYLTKHKDFEKTEEGTE